MSEDGRSRVESLLGSSSSFTDMTADEKDYFVQLLREEMERRKRDSQTQLIRPIVPIREWITERFLGPDARAIYPYWVDFLCNVFDENREKEDKKINTVILTGCFTGDTLVRVVDSVDGISFKELMELYGDGTPFRVYSCNSDGALVYGKACNPHITKVAKELAYVTLDGGKVIKCTPEHLFLIEDGSYKEARTLTPEDRLMSVFGVSHARSVVIKEANESVYDLEVERYHNFALSAGVFVHNSIGTGKSCLNDRTRIPTSLGLLELRELKYRFDKGERFKVLSESGVRDCVDVYDNGNTATKKIRFKSGRIVEGTYNHKFRVVRDGKISWTKFEDFRVGDRVILKRDGYCFGSIHMDPDEAYTLGYMVGDGWCEKSSTEGKFSTFQVMFQYENTGVARKIIRAYYRWFGGKALKSARSRVMPNGNHMVYMRSADANKATKLVRSGFGFGSRNNGIPNFIFMCDKETVSNFIQGLFDSGGTVEKSGYVYLSLMSEKCIRDVGSLLSMYGIDYHIRVKESYFAGKYMGKLYQLAICDTESYIRFEDEIGFNIDYKVSRLSQKVSRCRIERNPNDRIIVSDGCRVLRELDKINPLGSSNRVKNFIQFRDQDNYTLRQLKRLYVLCPDLVSQSDYFRFICENDVYFDEVESIEDGFCHTMDLEVEGDHSYCFDGFISHNTIAEIILLRKLYELSCYKNINAKFNLMGQASIIFLYFSINKSTAEATGFGSIRNWVDSSPYFQKYFPRKKRLDSLLVFPEGVTIAYGSRGSDAIGRNLICSIMDEANFIDSNGDNRTGNIEKASEMFAGIINRSNSRFIVDGGVNHSLNILVSSSTHESSATERQIAMSKDDPHTIVAAPSQWEVKPEKFSKKYFYVLKGTNYLEPQIIKSVDDVNNFKLSEGLPTTKYIDGETDLKKIEEEIEKLPPHQQLYFLKVPEDLRKGFEMNIIRSLQDLGGVSTGTTGKLFNSPAVFDACIDSKLKHPFIQPEIVISTGDTLEIKDFLRNDFRLKNLERPRYIHIDQSTSNDSTGISSVYASDLLDIGDGIKKPIFAVDFMLRVNPPKPPKKIAIYKIRNFVIFLSKVMGMKIGKVTYDIFNSEESRQILEEMGFNVGYQSVDRTDKAYLDLVEIMYEGRLKLYDYPILRYELFNLIHYRDKRKVDHPRSVKGSGPDGYGGYEGKGSGVGSKDVSDSLCLVGDTRVVLSDGRMMEIQNLAHSYNYRESMFRVCSCDFQGFSVPGMAFNPRQTKISDRIATVRLSNERVVRCTPEHKFLLEDKSYLEAENLKPYMSLMSIDRYCNPYVISVDIEEEHIPVYDLTVEGYHNFAIDAGVFVHNCGALENALQVSISTETGGNKTLNDFLMANQFRTGFEPDPQSIEEMVDKQIDEMIEEMEYSGMNSGGLLGLGF